MKIITLFFVSLICIQLFACNKNEEVKPVNTIDVNINPTNPSTSDTNTNNNKMRITIGTQVFTATFNESATATAFKAKLPLTINMTDLNRNEKFFDFAFNLPTNALNPRTIHQGDLMMYGENFGVFLQNFFNIVQLYKTWKYR